MQNFLIQDSVSFCSDQLGYVKYEICIIEIFMKNNPGSEHFHSVKYNIPHVENT